jgi:hypothetical protein
VKDIGSLTSTTRTDEQTEIARFWLASPTAIWNGVGDDPGVAIVATSPSNPGFERHWATLSEGVEEVIDARIYSGIHYRTSDEEGARVGRRIARFVVNHALRAAKQWD